MPTAPLIVYPATGGGKYHAARPITAQAACNGTVLLTVTNMDSIHVNVGDDLARVHPIVCRRCLRTWATS